MHKDPRVSIHRRGEIREPETEVFLHVIIDLRGDFELWGTLLRVVVVF